ncbi:enoyl-CoA hydratase [Colletotrichum salicis]|uniref:Enoyl-CoA hydratase n=1 Tax=Colletotrichum salicis TaxID=1209931 RepID=A0A135S5I2_9PEZI|nr:enoyl-CoA hydratase [Colletotrichum salicis]
MADNEPEAVQVHKSSDGITTITINREHRRNAIDGPTARKLTDAFLVFENDPTQKVCVFYGAHGTFCAGFDIHEVAQYGHGFRDSSYKGSIIDDRLELSVLGDIRVAEETAVFGVFCRRFGVPLIDGGAVRLQAVVGLGRALDMILTGRGVSTEEALHMGLANRVVPKGQALAEATNIARQLLAVPQACMNTDRTSCYYSAYNARSFEDALSNEFNEGIKVINTESVRGASEFSNGAGRHGSFEKAKI